MTELEHARQCLQSGDYTCVLCKGKTVHTSTERGVKPLLRWIASGEDFSGFSAADKVVGKGAAFLYVRLGVKAVYATVISKSAWQVLQTHEIPVECGQIVENIINRKGDGICPALKKYRHQVGKRHTRIKNILDDYDVTTCQICLNIFFYNEFSA